MTFNETRRTVLTLAAVAGMAFAVPGVAAAQSQDSGNRTTQSQQDRQDRTYVFQSAEKLLGKKVTNRQGDELATIDDMIVNRGTGRIEAVVIREGGFLGFGGTHVAIPYDAFFVDASNLTLSLNASEDMIESEDKRLPENWQRLKDGWEDDLSTLVSSEQAMRQKLPAQKADAEVKRMSGTITEVGRVDLGENRHWTRVRISQTGKDTSGARKPDKDSDGNRWQKDGDWVVLGPAWYANGAVGTPVRGERIDVEAFEGHDNKMYAKTATFDGETVQYRDDGLQPAWTYRSARSDSKRGPGPMVLLTNIIDENVIWGRSDDEVGEVSDAYLELTTGNVALLAIDTDGDWWGQDMGKRAVPFDIARIGRDAITLDASREMLGGAQVLPEDPAALRSPQNRERLFDAFEVDSPAYAARR